MRRVYSLTMSAMAIVVVGNAFYIAIPAYMSKHEDDRNKNVLMFVHLRWGLDPSTAVVDLLDISDEASMADVDRSLFDIADGLSSRTFSTVQLAFRGKAKFQMDGNYFHTLGKERSFQNPVYVVRTLPENLYRMDGGQAFGTWTGGWLGVINKQMEDHQQMHRDWYLDEMF